MEVETQTSIDGERLRAVMRRVPSPVTVVTAAGPEEARGITIGSFTSVSLDPPLISFNVSQEARMHGVIASADRFAVHILSEAQAHLSDHFALPDRTGPEQFADVQHELDPHGTPVLNDVLAVLHCRRYAVFEAGDHSVVIGEVVGLDASGKERALLYYDRGYRGVGGELEVELLATTKRTSNDSP